jgi:16S rRNA (cytosine967-C5)-methyltransferase
MLLAAEVPVREGEDAGALTMRLAEVGARLTVETLDALGGRPGRAPAQPSRGASLAPKVTAEEARLDFTWPAGRLADAVRAFTPAPGALDHHRGRSLKSPGPRSAAGGRYVPGRLANRRTGGAGRHPATASLEMVDGAARGAAGPCPGRGFARGPASVPEVSGWWPMSARPRGPGPFAASAPGPRPPGRPPGPGPAWPDGAPDPPSRRWNASERAPYANLALPALLRGRGWGPSDRAATTDLVYGSLRMRGRPRLRPWRPLSRQPLDPPRAPGPAGLRLGAYELLFGGTATHAAVAETVGAVGPGRSPRPGRLRQRRAAPAGRRPAGPGPTRNATRSPGPPPAAPIRPGSWRRPWPCLGPAELVALVEADNHRPEVSLRATPGRATREELPGRAHRGRRAGPPQRAQPRLRGPGARRPRPPGRRHRGPGGGPGRRLGPGRPGRRRRPRATWWPTWPPGRAARPGHLAALGARVLAVEAQPHRAAWSPRPPNGSGWPTGSTRWSATAAAPAAPRHRRCRPGRRPLHQPGQPAPPPRGPLAPPPRGRARLVELQLALLEAAADRLRPGGTLLYSVCTWTRAETDGVVAELLERRPDCAWRRAASSGRTATGADGMFLARLFKVR